MGKAARDFERDPESDHASTDDDYVVTRIDHLANEISPAGIFKGLEHGH